MEFKPIKGKQVDLYTCGITAYSYAHIGNLRTYIFEDILKRALLYRGFKVKHVMNVTDVGHLTSDADTGEDKVEKSARKEGKTAWEISEFYAKAFFQDIEKLNTLKPDIVCKATDHIKEQIELIKALEKKSLTYRIDDGIYFDTSKFKDYGRWANLNIEGLRAGARVEVVEGKRNPTDFALWKFSPKDQKRQMEWKSPWSTGFPGWHIECSAMAIKYLGENFDIHCGGVDHINVHHTNEIAQTEAATGKTFVNYWLHGGFLTFKEEKMAKSLGNIITLQTLVDHDLDPLAYRHLCLTTHYRSQLIFDLDAVKSSQKALERLYDFVERIRRADGKSSPHLKKIIKEFEKQFDDALNEDLNMPMAMSAFSDFMRNINSAIDSEQLSKKDAKEVLKTLKDVDSVLGLKLVEQKKEKIPEKIKKLVHEREKARKAKKFDAADHLRKKIKEFGWHVEDTPQGPVAKKIKS